MELHMQLSEQEAEWLQSLASNAGLSAEALVKQLIRQNHETLAMDMAFDRYPQQLNEGDDLADETHGGSPEQRAMRQRKNALKQAMIERARLQKGLND